MDPISAGLGIVGLGISLAGMFSGSSVAHQQAQVSMDVASQEGQQNEVRRTAMEMTARRTQMQILRTTQRARAQAIQAGVTQSGSLTGSGVQGGVDETTSEGAFGLQGNRNNLMLGEQMFNLDSKISQDKIQLASLGGQAATDQGITSLGGALMKAAPMAGNTFNSQGGNIYNNPQSGSVGNPFNLNSLY